MVYHPSFSSLAYGRSGLVFIVAAAAFALGVLTGETLRTFRATDAAAPAASARVATRAAPANADIPLAHRLDPGLVYPAETLRIIDGDTFEAWVLVWPGLDVDTKVRLRDVDAPELHARCGDELARAQAARAALESMLADGGVTLSRVGIDKYGGRVDAAVATRTVADVSAALLNGGFVRAYDGGKRGSWC